jgi:hypothetical protein
MLHFWLLLVPYLAFVLATYDLANQVLTGKPDVSSCSLVGTWHPTSWDQQNIITFDDKGRIEGVRKSSFQLSADSNAECSFSGNYTLSSDGYFTYSVELAPTCIYYASTATANDLVAPLFCYYNGPTYDSSFRFFAGCFISFLDSCKMLRFNAYNGINDGAVGALGPNVWLLDSSQTPSPKRPELLNSRYPVDCGDLKGVSVTTGQKFFSLKYHFVATANITYHHDGSYTSSLIGASCSKTWTGYYSLSPALGEAYPNLAALSYQTTGSRLLNSSTDAACATFADPATCDFYSESNTSVSRCSLYWFRPMFGDIPAESCSSFVIYIAITRSSYPFEVQPRATPPPRTPRPHPTRHPAITRTAHPHPKPSGRPRRF